MKGRRRRESVSCPLRPYLPHLVLSIYLIYTYLQSTALITISTRASLKRYHTFTLTLGLGTHGEEWEFQRIGTESEKSSVEKELAELREHLAKVEEWKVRRQEIEDELNRVWVEGDRELAPPPYEKPDAGVHEEGRLDVDSVVEETEGEEEELHAERHGVDADADAESDRQVSPTSVR